MPPTSIDGTDITGATIDGTDVQEITVDGQTVFTKTTTFASAIIDDFESGNLNNYFSLGGGGNPQIDSTTVAEGAFAFRHTNPNSPNISLKSNTGLNSYPQKGDIFSNLIYIDNGDWSIGFGFGLPGGTADFPLATFSMAPGRDEIALFGFDSGGSLVSLDRPGTSTNFDQWYDVVIEWHDGSGSQPDNTIVWELYEVDTSIDLTQNQGHTNLVDSGSAVFSDISGNTSIIFTEISSFSTSGLVDRIVKLGTV